MTENIFIDATGSPLGRISSYSAKQALLGNKIFVLNCEKAIVSGNKTTAVREYKEERAKGGSSLKGPFNTKDPERMLRNCIRGMLPDYSRGRGKEAWKRIRCHNGIPEEYKKVKIIKIKTKTPIKSISLDELGQKM